MVITMVLATTGASGGPSKKAPIKVKQDMIDFIKAQGMTKALKRAGSLQAKGTKGEAEFIEGVRRMYGASRLSAATTKAKPATAPKPTDSRFSGVKKAAPKPTDSRFSGIKKTTAAPKMPGKGPAVKVAAAKKSPRFGGFSLAADAITGKNSNTSASVAARRKAAAAAVKRGGGRSS